MSALLRAGLPILQAIGILRKRVHNEQLRLTIEALRERQEHELINNREFGLLHNADFKQRVDNLRAAQGKHPSEDFLLNGPVVS